MEGKGVCGDMGRRQQNKGGKEAGGRVRWGGGQGCVWAGAGWVGRSKEGRREERDSINGAGELRENVTQ